MNKTQESNTSEQDYDARVRQFQEYSKQYVKKATLLFYQADSYELLPKEVSIMKIQIIEYIVKEKIQIITNSLNHHDEIINFTLDNFAEDDDEQTERAYGNTVSQYNTENFNVMAMLLQIKRRAKRLNKEKFQKVKNTISELSALLKSMQSLA